MDGSKLNDELEKSNCELILDSKCRAYSTPLELAEAQKSVDLGGKRELKKCLSCPIRSKKLENITEDKRTIITEQPVSTPNSVITEPEKIVEDRGQCSSHGGGSKPTIEEVGCFHVAENSSGRDGGPSSRCYCHVESSWKCVSYCFCYDCFVATLYHCFWEDNMQYQQAR